MSDKKDFHPTYRKLGFLGKLVHGLKGMVIEPIDNLVINALKAKPLGDYDKWETLMKEHDATWEREYGNKGLSKVEYAYRLAVHKINSPVTSKQRKLVHMRNTDYTLMEIEEPVVEPCPKEVALEKTKEFYKHNQ